MQILAFLLARFSEPSSYAGLGAILALAGLHFSVSANLGQDAGHSFPPPGAELAALLLKERRAPIQMIALAVLVGAALGACAPLAGVGAAVGAIGTGITVADTVAGTVDTTIQAACREYEKGRAAANAVVATGLVPTDASGKVDVIEEYGDAACADPPSRATRCRPRSGSASWSGRSLR